MAVYEITQIFWRKYNLRQLFGILSLSIAIATTPFPPEDDNDIEATNHGGNGLDRHRYGFAYIPDRTNTDHMTHIYGKWYIF